VTGQGKKTGDAPPKATKLEVLSFIHFYTVKHGTYPTVDDIAEKLRRPRKVMADFMSRYARYGIVDAFKDQGQKTRYGPGVNWSKIDGFEWRDFFRAGSCPSCGRGGVGGVMGPKSIYYRCKWCRHEWTESRDWADKDTLAKIETQAEKTKRQWVRS